MAYQRILLYHWTFLCPMILDSFSQGLGPKSLKELNNVPPPTGHAERVSAVSN